jgi:hypothetical protein
MPLSLSDEELAAVMDAAAPIPGHARNRFLQDLAAEVAQHSEIGPGLIGRLAREMQPC